MSNKQSRTKESTVAAPKRNGFNRLFLLILASCCIMIPTNVWKATLRSTSFFDHQASYLLSFQPPRAFEGRSSNGSNSTTRMSGDDDDSFSACLLIMDDNHRLVEWIAYHYHVLPLRYLIVAVDPRSVTSPSRILNQWRNYGMTILEWSDDDFLRSDELTHRFVSPEEFKNNLTDEQRKGLHRGRQKTFMSRCLVALKKANRTWVVMEDSDEFLLYNEPPSSGNQSQKAASAAPTLYPSLQEPSSLIHFLNAWVNQSNSTLASPCISVPRLRYGSIESDPTLRDAHVPPAFNATRFDTLRWRHHAKPEQLHPYNGLAKTLVDVSRVNVSDIPPQAVSAHRPLPLCRRPFLAADKNAIFRINHYSGSWEAYSFRDDARFGTTLKGRQNFEQKDEGMVGTDDTIRPWLSGFVKEHGVQKASEMLRDVGVFTPKNISNS